MTIKEIGKKSCIGGLTLSALLYGLRYILASELIGTLPSDQVFRILLVMTVGLFVIGILGIIAWIFGNNNADTNISKVIATNGSVGFGDNARNNTVTVNNTSLDSEKQ